MRIAIAGGGIAGLAAAIALAARGFSVELHERATFLEEVGAGIQLSPNATAVLQRLGVLDGLAWALVEPEAIEIRDAANGARLTAIPLGATARQRYGAPYCLVHRADLQAGLAAVARTTAGIDFHLNAKLSGAQDLGDGVAFVVERRKQRADILIAADGIHSAVRTDLLGHPGPQPLGRTAWRATLPVDDVPSQFRRDATGLWLGPGGHLVHYPVRAGKNMNVVVITAGEKGGESSDRPPREPFGREAAALIDAVQEWTPWPLFGVDPARAWARGRVALIGDAAHAMAPSAAQGGAQAIEDAWVLAASLAARPDDPAAALAAYERARRPRVERVVREAMRNLSVYNMRGFAATARNTVLGAMSSRMLLSRLDWLYGWKPE